MQKLKELTKKIETEKFKDTRKDRTHNLSDKEMSLYPSHQW